MGYRRGAVLRTAFNLYTIQERQGAGGSGEVYKAQDHDAQTYAIKVLDPKKANTITLKRFKNEINFCSKNVHRNIVQVLDSGITENGATFYVMPLYSGTLRTLITRGIRNGDVLRAFGQILDGVEAAHLQGVWHRDLKPENILTSATGDLLVVADFGIAHFEEEAMLTAVETKKGDRLANFLYAAPEQKSRGERVDAKADVYALGLILNEMFTKVVPLGTRHQTVAQTAPNYAYLDGLVDVMLSQDPSLRPSIDQVKKELIGRGNEFLVIQRLNSLKSRVIPETEVDDPIVRNPIALQAFDVQDEDLLLILSAPPPSNWVAAFQGIGSYTGYRGHGPETFTFDRDVARVHFEPGIDLQQLLNYAKDYIKSANLRYAQEVIADTRKKQELEREKLRRKIVSEDRRAKALAEIRI